MKKAEEHIQRGYASILTDVNDVQSVDMKLKMDTASGLLTIKEASEWASDYFKKAPSGQFRV
ncbi:hypothetical protein [Candidatus Methanoperedens nitratireducens]|nr:hypothetical protein [Candidatus Methanoperedens nitroreducens]